MFRPQLHSNVRCLDITKVIIKELGLVSSSEEHYICHWLQQYSSFEKEFTVIIQTVETAIFADHIVTDLIKALLGNSSVNTFKHAPCNSAVEVFSLWSTPCNSMCAVFSSWSMPRLYNGNVFAAEKRLVEYRLVQSQD
jgi:hypothetical protein